MFKQTKFLEINPTLNTKNSILEPHYSKPEGAQGSHFYAVCEHCQKCLKDQTKIETEENAYCVSCFATILPECSEYRVLSHEFFAIVDEGWPAAHELIMFEAIEKYGFGNWDEAKKYMDYFGAHYLMDEIEAHYDKFYGNNSNFIPNFLEDIALTKVHIVQKMPIPSQSKEIRSNQRYTNTFSLEPALNQFNPVKCYNQKRDEFVSEYNEELEKYVANLEFRADDSQKQFELKMQIVEAYNRGLRDRYEKYRFILEHKLMEPEHQLEEQKLLETSSDYFKDAHKMLKPLMRYFTLTEFQQLRKSVEFCLKVQAIIDGLRQIRADNVNSSLESIGQANKILQQPLQSDGKPRKRVHKNPENAREEMERKGLSKLNLSKEQLRHILAECKRTSSPFLYKGIKVSPIKK